MQLFYEPNILDTHTLNPIDSKHCVRVLRHTVGDQISVMDGIGNWFNCEIIEDNPKKCKVSILSKKEDNPRKSALHIAVAPTKNIDRLEWFLEKATEMGIEQITPILCEHSERKIIKPERLEKVIISAMKQSLKAYKPILNQLTPFKAFIAKNSNADNSFIAHCNGGTKDILKSVYPKGENTTIMIGPEGDFSVSEVELALKSNFRAISLGEARLRTETAALMTCATFNITNM
ncbi:16S rRNA (uracil(1498)-N(3))-methyltransferase [Saccharicrinis aurantiacus]|uniref:16S rRNA (uracil(1498)-N(3))-methyltransferase n=1 Tax=Saccharicrinis aurantiacus TaxID=1849719 RepID=UPI0009501278|nr:16S rRNA (uracil(1498)-N(3))-methyltransferase [Saccharicrinis aurantiacus]